MRLAKPGVFDMHALLVDLSLAALPACTLIVCQCAAEILITLFSL